MAVRDIKNYYYTMLDQYCQEKENLADYEQAFKEGYITEDQLSEAKDYFAKLEENFERVKYIIFLLDAPNRKAKQPKYNKQHAKELAEFEAKNATLAQVEAENKQLMTDINSELDKLTKSK